jgi:hypothetical protein
MSALFSQLARSGLLFDDDMVAAILAGNSPPLEEIVLSLIITCMDSESTVRNDSTSTWNHRRIARQGLAVAFLAAIACMKEKAS